MCIKPRYSGALHFGAARRPRWSIMRHTTRIDVYIGGLLEYEAHFIERNLGWNRDLSPEIQVQI